MIEIILIAAVGKQGQLGLKGKLPWGEDFKEDRIRFRDVTENGVVVSGHRTYTTIKHLHGTGGRAFILDVKENPPSKVLSYITETFPNRKIFIAGGAKTYTRWLPYVTRFDITQLPYTGPADVYMPTLFEHQPVPTTRKEWLQSSIAAIDRAIVNPDHVDPFVLGQAQAKRQELNAELFALTGESHDPV